MLTRLVFQPDILRDRMDGRPRSWLREKTGIGEVRIDNIFLGVEPKATELFHIARALKCAPEDFMVEVEYLPDAYDLDKSLKRPIGKPRKRIAA